MKILLILVFLLGPAGWPNLIAQPSSPKQGVEGIYRRNLTFVGPITGDEIVYTLYLFPGHRKEQGPFPVIIFLHGAGGGNASLDVVKSYEAARKANIIGDHAIIFPEKYPGTVWRNGNKGKKPETNVLKELLPHLEKKYALARERRQRTIMGFSMGAAGSLYWGARYLDVFSTAVALDAGGGTSSDDESARNHVPDYLNKTDEIREHLEIRLVEGALNTRSFRHSLDQLKIPYDFEQLPGDIAAYPPSSPCRNRRTPSRKMLHNPSCLITGEWGRRTWAFIEKNTPPGRPLKD